MTTCTHPDHGDHAEPAVARLLWTGRPPVEACLPHLLYGVEHAYAEGDPAHVEPLGGDDPAAPAVDVRVASHVLWHYGHAGGYEPGSFTIRLIELIVRADPANRRRLALTFPAYVAAVDLAAGNPGGVDRLRAIARGGQ